MTRLNISNQSINQPDTAKHRRVKSGLIMSVFGFILLFAGFTLFNSRETVVDYMVAWQFTPTEEVIELAKDAGINSKGVFYLKASRAEVRGRASFNDACGELQNERTVVIGCYTGNDRRIYVYDVTNKQLSGVKETTVAHEMLHAVYDRLSTRDRKRVEKLLVAEKAKVTDERILRLIKEYEISEPDEVVNEMHSIFGTEVRGLSPELEEHYSQYFSEREKVISLKDKYESVFTELVDKQKSLVDEIDALVVDINTRQERYSTLHRELNADIEKFNTMARSGRMTSGEYNSRRIELQARIGLLDSERSRIINDIDLYNLKKSELDELNMRAENLNQSINSKVAPAIPVL